MPQDRPCWLLSSEQQGRQIMAPSPESTSVHDGFFSEGSPVPFRAPPHPWTLSAGFSSSLFPSVFKLRGLPRESPRQNSQVLIPGDSWGPWKRQLCGEPLPSSERLPFLNESWAGAGRAAAASSPLLWRLLPSLPTGHMQQVQSQQCAGRRGRATPRREPLFLPLTLSSLPGSCLGCTFPAGCIIPSRNPTAPSLPQVGSVLPPPSCIYSLPTQGF